MSRRQLALLSVLGLFASLGAGRAYAGTATISFVMPTSVDPPKSVFLNSAPVGTDNNSLLAGLNLYGRALSVSQSSTGCNVVLQDITCITIQFTSTGNVKVNSTAAKGFSYTPWSVNASKSGSTWTITLCAAPGSVPLSSWAVGSIGTGFFAALTASQGSNPADISNVIIMPGGQVPNTNNKPSANVTDPNAPGIGASVDKPFIWSPNGKPVNVTLAANIADSPTQDANTYVSGVNPCSIQVDLSYTDGGTPVDLHSVPITLTANGDGSYMVTTTLPLASSRNGTSLNGRIYTFTITASDNANPANPATPVTVTVTVSHDQGSP